ncbi:unnamed protein product [Acanthoscelides obtectus]|uniref:Uncharacterized protein n=1 Tax=Acanthoscelides obtectus TaxID=200917 RepID=A0A9P0PY98_ACAOB|nr:unnamed protein product [Acanthoscelides obtectus]CAK1680267.1 hypothetical protein AOBTE_LOCUS32554 [Acanthoscelides obtectus]
MLKDSIPIFDGYSNNISTFLRKSTEFYNALPISYKGHALTFIKSRLQGEPAEFTEQTNPITIEHLSAILTTRFKDYQTEENLTRQLFDIHSPDYSVLHSEICNKLHELREFARLNYPPEIAPAMIARYEQTALTSFLCGINSKYHCVALQPPPKNIDEAKRLCQEHDNLLQTKQYKEFLVTKSKPQTNKPVRPPMQSYRPNFPNVANLSHNPSTSRPAITYGQQFSNPQSFHNSLPTFRQLFYTSPQSRQFSNAFKPSQHNFANLPQFPVNRLPVANTSRQNNQNHPTPMSTSAIQSRRPFVRPNLFSNNGQRPSTAVQELTNNESEPTNESSTENVANPFESYYSEAFCPENLVEDQFQYYSQENFQSTPHQQSPE